MTVRAVEGKKPYTWWIAIEITEDKVINLRLRDENNLIIYDSGDNEIYVDLQLPDWIKPTDAFPVWITTGRVLVADGWDTTGTLICAKTTSGDNIKVFYADDWKLWIDNWTGLFKQIYLASEVDTLLSNLRAYIDSELAKKQDKLTAGANITIDANNVISSTGSATNGRFLSLWDCSTWEPISFPTSTLPFVYESGDHYMVETVDSTTNYRPDWTEYTGVASTTVETEDVQVWDVYVYDWNVWLLQLNHNRQVSFSQIAWQPEDNTALANALNDKQNTLTAGNGINIDQNNEISIDTTVVATQTNLASKQDTLTAGEGIDITDNTIYADEIVIDMADIVIWDDWRVSWLASAFFWTGVTIKDGDNYYKVWKAVQDNINGVWDIYASNGDDGSGHTTGYHFSWDGYEIQTITQYTNNYFATIDSTAPSNPIAWKLWYDTANSVLKIYDGSVWQTV